MNSKEFKNPPIYYRPLKYMVPSDPSDSSNIQISNRLKEISNLKYQGFGGVMTGVNTHDYLDNEGHWKALRKELGQIEKLGMRAWIWDDRGRPSGKAAGKVVERYPEGQSRALLYTAMPEEGSRHCRFALPLGRALFVRAHLWEGDHLTLDNAVHIENSVENGEIRVDLPSGRWLIMAFVERLLHAGTFAADRLSGDEPYLNILDRKAAESFLEVNYEVYRANIGDYFGNVVEAFHTDEVMLTTTAFPVESEFPPFPAIPWLPSLPDLFSERYGYDLIPSLPALFNNVGPRTAGIRCDFYRLIAELCSQAYFQTLADWCQANDLKLKVNPLGEESLIAHTAFEGSIYHCLAPAHVPAADILSVTIETFKSRDQCLPAPKMVSSVAHLMGREQAVCDFSDYYQYNAGIKTTIEELRACIGWACVQGCTVNLCGWYDRTTEELRHLNDYAARVGLALTGGFHIADLAVLYPITTIWAHYVPSTDFIMLPPIGSLERPRVWSDTYAAEASVWDVAFRDLVWELLEHQWDFDIVDDVSLAGCRFDDSKLCLGDESYRALILPPMDVVDPRSLRQASRWIREGGLVVAFYPLPYRSTRQGEDDKLQSEILSLFGEQVPLAGEYAVRNVGEGKGIVVADIEGLVRALRELVEPDIFVEPDTRNVFSLHRRKGNRDIYFLVNNISEPVNLTVTLCAKGQPEIWDPSNGTISRPSKFETTDGRTRLQLSLDSYSGILIVIEKETLL